MALRLELAAKERRNAPALFCWDEPFAHFDAQAQEQALAMLAETLKQQPAWQMLLFTCNPQQAAWAEKYAREQALIHPL